MDMQALRNLVDEAGDMDALKALLEEAGADGSLSIHSLLQLFPDARDNPAMLDHLLDQLEECGVTVEAGSTLGDHQANDEDDSIEPAVGVIDTSHIPSDDSVGLYFAQSGNIPLLTHAQEVALAKKIEQGKEAELRLSVPDTDSPARAELCARVAEGQRARAHLIEANTRLVVSIAKRYRGHGLPFEDLIQAGNLGLIKAIDKYDYRKGTRVSTYATWWIRQAVTRSLSNQARLIRLPANKATLIRRIHREAARLAQDGGYRPSPEEIAKSVDLSVEGVRQLMQMARRPLSLSRPIGEHGEGELVDLISDEDAPAPLDEIVTEDLAKDLAFSIAELPPREAKVLKLRYGLADGQSRSLAEVGEHFGFSRERARQLELRALRRLRHPRRARTLRHHLR